MENLTRNYVNFSKSVLRSPVDGVGEVTGQPQLLAGDNTSSNSCVLLVDDSNLRDGRLPQVLAIALGAWLVSQLFQLFVTFVFLTIYG